MRGVPTKWTLGTDHAGIATQMQVEKKLRKEGKTRHEIGREEFLKQVWEWRSEHGSTIIEQLKRLGATCDYSKERFTLDEGYAEAVLKVFVELYNRGYIYRDRYMVNWDPGTQSAISDLEVEERDVVDTLYYIKYRLVSGDGYLTVATVRPETLLADTAVAVNPEDERFKELIGQEVELPIVGKRLPIIADEYVKIDFGTGALKITPGHDPNDFEVGQRHNLEQISVIGEDGRMNEQAGEPYAGMTTAEAQKAVVERLKQDGLLEKEEEYPHTVPFSHRSGERIEPLISLQWFMQMEELAKPAIDVVKSGKVKFTPQRWGKVYLEWMENIRPWCLSRQLWWGHRLPVWYRDSDGETYVGTETPEAAGLEGQWRQDEDVLDTWFSSALWPFATLGWPDETADLDAFYPTNVLSTARDIIFLWVARMVMMGIEFTGEIPFDDVYIHSVIQAPDGRRMSKSLGTGIDPLSEIDEHGADAVRFGLLAMSSSQDVRYSAEKVQQGRQLANKLWNAARFVLLQIPTDTKPEPSVERIEDRWILSRLAKTEQQLVSQLQKYDFSHAALGLYDFVYGDLCDWYIEFVKPRLNSEQEDNSSLYSNLLYVLTETLKIAHPLTPFVTEEIYSYIPAADGLLAEAEVAKIDSSWIDNGVEEQISTTIEVVKRLRNWRDQVQAKAKSVIPARLEATVYNDTAKQIAELTRFEFKDSSGEQSVATVSIPGGTVHVLATDEINLSAMEQRVQKQREKIQAEIKRAEGKLGNQGFISKAPQSLIDAEQKKLEELKTELAAL